MEQSHNPPQFNPKEIKNIDYLEETPTLKKEKRVPPVYIFLFIGLLVIGLIIYSKKNNNNQEQVEMAADYYCIVFQLRNELELGEPQDITRPLIFTMEQYNSKGQDFQNLLIVEIQPFMQKYSLDSGKLAAETKKLSEYMKEEDFRKRVAILLEQRGDCLSDWLD